MNILLACHRLNYGKTADIHPIVVRSNSGPPHLNTSDRYRGTVIQTGCQQPLIKLSQTHKARGSARVVWVEPLASQRSYFVDFSLQNHRQS